MPLLVPFAPDVPDQRFKTALDGETFTLRARWNARAATWFLSIADADGELAAGLPLTLGSAPLRQLSDRRLPRGPLLCIDTTGRGEDAGLSDLGARVKVLYYESTELAA